MALKTADLDKAVCGNPNCTQGHSHQLFINARCHAKKPPSCYYDKNTASLHLRCSVCGKPVAEIAVAK